MLFRRRATVDFLNARLLSFAALLVKLLLNIRLAFRGVHFCNDAR
jgi:hypothetical protein